MTVSSLRVPVKKAKVCATHKITTQIKRMRGKKGSDEQRKANGRKADRLVEELQLIKKLNADKVAKFSLGNILTWENVTTQFKGDLEMKALVRLSVEKPLQNKVNKWRSEHSDWRSLASYIVQHTGRKFKPKDTTTSKDTENKPKFKHQLRETGNQSAHAQVMEEEDSSYHSDDTYSGDAVDEVQSESESEADSEDIQSKREALLGPDAVAVKSRTIIMENKNQTQKSDVVIESSINQYNQTEALKNQRTSNIDSNSDSGSDDENLSHESEEENSDASVSEKEHKQSSSIKSKNIQKKDTVPKNKKNVTVSSKVTLKEDIADISSGAVEQSGEMVVRKLDLQAFADDADADISFLFTGSDKAVTSKADEVKRKRPRSAFFLTGAGHSDAPESSGEESAEAESESDEEQVIGEARRAMHESNFLGSLAGPAKKFKDFAAIRKEIRSSKKQAAGFQKQNKQGRDSFKQKNMANRHGRESFKQKNTAKPTSDKKDVKKKIEKQVVAKDTATTDEKLHPSWEASRKRKLQQTAIPSFTGKKRTFDD